MVNDFSNKSPLLSAPNELTALRTHLTKLERDVVHLKWANEAIHALASCPATVEGQEFLVFLARRLSEILHVAHILITELVPRPMKRVRIVAGWIHGQSVTSGEYELSNTPCELVLTHGSAFFPEGVHHLFPESRYLIQHHIESYIGEALFTRTGRPRGHLCVMDKQPFVFDPIQGRAIVKAFAALAGTELERLHADAALRQREERFRTLYDDNPSMSFTLSPDGLIVSVNRYGAAQLGYTVNELVGHSVLTVFDETDRETVLTQLQQCADHPFRTFTWDIQKLRKDGSRLWVHERARAILDSEGNLIILVVGENVTKHRRTSRLLSTLIRESPLPIVSLDQTAKVTSWNPAATKLFGWTEEEVIGKELPYIPPGEEEAADRLWKAGVRGELTAPVELRRRRKDGALLDLLLWPVYVRERPGGKFETAIGILVDQSNLVRAEAARRESERRLRMIIDSEPECVKIVNVDGLIASMNPAGLALLGATSERDILGKSVLSFIHPDDRPTYERFHQMVCAGERGVLTFRLIDLHGQQRHLESHAVPLRDDAGIVTGTLSITRDITVCRQAEEALRASESLLHRFVADAPIGLVIADRNGRLLHVNRAFCELTGYSAEEMLGRTSALYTHPDDLGESLRLAVQLADGNRSNVSLEQRYVRKNGDIIWVAVKVTPVQLPTHDQPLLLAAVHDVTEQQKSERLLAEEKRILESIAADAPLSSVLETICTMVEVTNPHLLCSIVFLDARHNCLRPGPAPSLPPAYVALVDGVPIGPSVGSCGTAAYTGKPVIVSDIATDPLWASWRDLPLAHGLRSCWSMPIKSPSGQVLGSFAIYSRTPRHPTPGDLALMERTAHLAGIAMMRARAREEREQLSQDLHDNILQSLYAIGMQLEASRLSSSRSAKQARTHMVQAINQLNRLVGDIRQYIAFLKHASRPTVNFGQALQQLVTSIPSAKEHPPHIDIHEHVLSLITEEQSEHLLNIAREALSNSLRHSRARSRIIRLFHTGTAIRLEIRDDGIGFDPKKRRKRGHGLSHMAARAKHLGAQFTLESQRGKGTHITVDVPIKKRA
ncbi:MAG: PAS domain S-box protein [Nitrospira sp.]